jgi:hypothetical protein
MIAYIFEHIQWRSALINDFIAHVLGLASLGTDISEERADDFFAILDRDGDGEIDYTEFARWFGAGPPPPPMLPQVKAMQDAQAAARAGGVSHGRYMH